MYEVLSGPDPVIAMRYVGLISKADIDDTFAICRARLARNPRISAYVDISDWNGFDAAGLLEDLKEGFEALQWIGRIDRKAVVSDTAWIHTWISFAGSFLPAPQVKAFKSAEKAQALAWAAEPYAKPQPA
jgi:hypothetical protein